MISRQVFCSACDREVRVLIAEPTLTDGQAPLPDAEAVCLEIGKQCTGAMCPIGAAAPDAMVGRIIRNGLPLSGLRTVHATCPSCDLESDLVLYGDGRAVCATCGGHARWRLDHAEPM